MLYGTLVNSAPPNGYQSQAVGLEKKTVESRKQGSETEAGAATEKAKKDLESKSTRLELFEGERMVALGPRE